MLNHSSCRRISLSASVVGQNSLLKSTEPTGVFFSNLCKVSYPNAGLRTQYTVRLALISLPALACFWDIISVWAHVRDDANRRFAASLSWRACPLAMHLFYRDYHAPLSNLLHAVRISILLCVSYSNGRVRASWLSDAKCRKPSSHVQNIQPLWVSSLHNLWINCVVCHSGLLHVS